MTDDDERKQLYKNYRDHLITAQLSNSESLDKSVLTLSTTFLGLSITFIKDIVDLASACYVFLLKLSWGCFVVAIVSTILSIIVSQMAIDVQMVYAEKYYLEKKEEYLKKPNPNAKRTLFLNRFSAFSFIGAIGATVAFVFFNLSR